MKTLLISFFALAVASVHGIAQPKKSGAIQFQSNFDPAAMAAANGIKLSDDIIARMPKSSAISFELLFNLTNASYMRVEDIEDSNEGGGNGGGMRFGGFGGGNKDYYYNFADHQLTEVFDLNDTTYFLQSKLGEAAVNGLMNPQSPPVVEYINTDETKKIIGLDCKKVIIKVTSKRRIKDEEKEITDQSSVWYTDQLGFDFSPVPSLWTAGTVLAIEGKGTSIIAKSIEYRNVSSRDVNLPKKGTPITAEAYRIKMEQRMKMRGNRNRGQVRTMTIN